MPDSDLAPLFEATATPSRKHRGRRFSAGVPPVASDLPAGAVVRWRRGAADTAGFTPIETRGSDMVPMFNLKGRVAIVTGETIRVDGGYAIR